VSLPRWLAGENPRRTALRAAVLIGLAYLTFGHVLMPVRGAGISMSPTIASGELIFINRLTYRFREPRRGDVVAVRMAGRSVVYVKRLLALPGDRVKIEASAVSINGEWINEPYAHKRDDWWLAEATLGTDEYFVVGDNRIMPMHLHEMGTVSRARLIGPLAFP
jgi:signal peptidase I